MRLILKTLTLFPSPIYKGWNFFSSSDREFKRGEAPLLKNLSPSPVKERGIKGVRYKC